MFVRMRAELDLALACSGSLQWIAWYACVRSHTSCSPRAITLAGQLLVLLPALVYYIPPAVSIITGECWGYFIVLEIRTVDK